MTALNAWPTGFLVAVRFVVEVFENSDDAAYETSHSQQDSGKVFDRCRVDDAPPARLFIGLERRGKPRVEDAPEPTTLA